MWLLFFGGFGIGGLFLGEQQLDLHTYAEYP